MVVSTKKQQLIDQLMRYYNNDQSKVILLGQALKMLGLNTDDEAFLHRIEQYPEAFTTIITMSDLGILDKVREQVDILKGP